MVGLAPGIGSSAFFDRVKVGFPQFERRCSQNKPRSGQRGPQDALDRRTGNVFGPLNQDSHCKNPTWALLMAPVQVARPMT